MKGKIILAGNAIVLGAFAACNWSADPVPKMDVDVRILADGIEHKAGQAERPIPADTLQMRVLARVTAPPGDWQLTLEVDGALSLQGADGGTGADAGVVQRSVHTVRDDEPVEVVVTAYPQPTGEALIRASLPALTKTFHFQITPIVPQISICRPGVNGGCAPPGESPGDLPPDEEGVLWLPFPPSPGDDLENGGLRDGERALLVISTHPTTDRKGVAWTGDVTTDGVLSLIDGDKDVKTRTIDFKADSGSLYVPVRVTGSGAGSAFAQVRGGPKASLFVKTSSSAVAPRRIEFIGYVGLRAQNRVTLCSSRSAGTLTASLDAGAGEAGSTLYPSQVPLGVVPGGACGKQYPGLADFVWTGSELEPVWTVKDEVSDAGVLFTVPVLGTEGVAAKVGDVSLSWLTDAGVAGVDGGPKGALGQVTGTLLRNFTGQDGGPAEEPLANTYVEVKKVNGITPDPSSFTTDAEGKFSFTLEKADWLPAALLFVEIDHRFTLQLLDVKP